MFKVTELSQNKLSYNSLAKQVKGNLSYNNMLMKSNTEASWVGRQGERALPLASEIQKIFGNFKTLYQLRICVMTSCDLNVNVRRKNIKLCSPH